MKDEFLGLARAAQFRVIKDRMVTQYVGGRRELNEFDDFSYHLSTFQSYCIHGVPVPTARRKLCKMVAAGELLQPKRGSDRKGKVLRFQFSRECCDAMAAIARAELIAEGVLPKVTP